MSSAPPRTSHGPGPGEQDAQPRRHHRARIAVVVLGVAAITTVIVLDRHNLAKSLSLVGSLNLLWFAAGIACECVSLTAFGLSRRRLLRADGHAATFRSVMAITYAGNALSMSVPFAGSQLAVVFSYRQFRRRGLDPAITGWALGVSAIASSSALAVVLVVGALLGGAPLATAAGFLGAAVFALPGITVILALRYQRARALANRALSWGVSSVRRIFRLPVIDPAVLEEFLQRLSSIRLSWQGYAEVFGLAVANWIFDCAVLACAIRAVGQSVPWYGLLLAYGAGAIAGSTGVTPGGFLIVEVTLTASLVAAGLTAGPALGAVLAYRLINIWGIIFGGGIVLIVLTRMRDSRVRQYAPIEQKAAARGSTTRDPVVQRTADRPR